jgi:hypothetical protein
MGNTESKNKTNTNIVNDTVNETSIKLLNKNIFTASVNTLINQANTCSSATDVNTNCSASNIKTTEGITINADQSNKVTTNFSCVDDSKASADMSIKMMQELQTQMKGLSQTDYDTLAKSMTASQQKSDAATLGNTSSSNITNTNIKNKTRNEIETDVKNIFEQNLNNNFTQDTVKQCINKTSVNANTSVDNATGKFLDLKCVQTNDVQTVSECKFLNEAVAKTTTETLNQLGLKTESDNTTKAKTTAESSTKSENTATGAGQGLAAVIDSVGNAVGNILGGLGLAFMAPYIGIICCVCSVISVIVCILSIASQGMGGDGGEGGEGGEGGSENTGMNLQRGLSNMGLNVNTDKVKDNFNKGIDSFFGKKGGNPSNSLSYAIFN